MRRMNLLLCTALAGCLVFTGCGTASGGSSSASTDSNTSAESTDSENKGEQKDDSQMMGRIESIDGDEITVASGGGGMQGGEAPSGDAPSGEAPSGEAPSGEAPSEAEQDTASSDNTQADAESTETPSDSAADEGSGTPPEMPEGSGQGEQPEMESTVIKVSDDTEILDESGEAITIDDLSEGDMITVELDTDGATAAKISLGGGPGNGGGQGGPGGGDSASAPTSYTTVNDYTEDATSDAETLESTGTDENVGVVSNGATVTLNNPTVTKTSEDSTGGDSSSFYGVGAALLATDGTLNITGGTIDTDSAGGAGVFSYDKGVVNVSDTTISTKKDTSGGIHVAGGGTLNASNLTVTTEGESSAAIRSDRGSGTMTVDGGSYTSNGTGSPAVYSTADITVSNADLTANNSEAVCIEGLNSLKLTDCNLTGNIPDDERNDCNWTVILYQSMSGDSEEGNSTFDMTGGTLTSKNGGLFYTTNTESTFHLSGVELTTSDSDDFLLKCTGNSNQRGWGTTGANGADCTFTADAQTMEGKVIWDSISSLELQLMNKSSWTGSIEQDETNAGDGGDGYANVTVDDSSTWTVTGDSTLSTLTNSGSIVDSEGKTVTIVGSDGTSYVEGDSSYTITVDSYTGA